jgi:hypothetical protein
LTIAHSDISCASDFFKAATIPSGHEPRAFSKARGSVDWERAIAVALLENSVTILNDRLDLIAPRAVPSEVRERIGRLALIWKFKLNLLERRLRESVGVLADADIEVTLLKGAALALTVYPSFSDRPMADVDIMVSPDAARRSHELLRRAGWAVETGDLSPAAWNDHHHLPPLSDRDGSGLRLEVHVTPLEPGHPYRLSAESVLASAREIDVDGHTVRVPEPHLHAVHAAIHFAFSHQFASGGLNVFRDIAMLRAAGALDWGTFVEKAHQTRSEACCYWTARLASALAGVTVPDEVMQRLSPPIGAWSLSLLEQHFSQLILRTRNSCPSVELRHRLWAFAVQVAASQCVATRRWEEASGVNRARRSSLQRLITHVSRAPHWWRYVASLVVPVIELSA